MRLSTALGLSVLALHLLPSGEARACGGTFCDSGPTAMPVDQTGENVLFVLDGQTVEAHVQIQYQGVAERFAWVVPMQEVPEVSVGSQLLFQNLLQATVPTYGFNTQQDFCGPADAGSFATGGSGGSGAFAGASGAAGQGGGGPQVVFQKSVGAFEVTVLKGGTAQEVSDWLSTNNYQTTPNAPQLLEQYVLKNHVFAAIKLTADTSTDEIHPLVFKYPGNEPCVPIQLTAVGAVEDMGIRVFFLGDDRVVPTNYKHIVLNPVRLNWLNFAQNYNMSVTRGADSAIADGHAFATEYAGSSGVVSTFGVYDPAWDATPFQGLAAQDAVTELTQQGLMFCTNGFCQYNHPLLRPLLDEYLPPPLATGADNFYSCLYACSPGDCTSCNVDTQAWDAAQFAADFQARIVDPATHAAQLLAKWPYLTRMYTTISPAEMTVDPMFHAQPGLPGVAANAFATRQLGCNGEDQMVLPDGRQVALVNSSWPAWDSFMPWVEKIEEYPIGGEKITLVDNTEKIDQQLAKWNDSNGLITGGAGGWGGNAGNGAGGAGGAANGASPAGGGEGCGCQLPGRGPGAGSLLALVLGLGLGLGRRRARR